MRGNGEALSLHDYTWLHIFTGINEEKGEKGKRTRKAKNVLNLVELTFVLFAYSHNSVVERNLKTLLLLAFFKFILSRNKSKITALPYKMHLFFNVDKVLT